jgi:hypothetical protein
VLLWLVPGGQRSERDRKHRQPDEQVDQEHPAPAFLDPGQLHDHPAQERPGRSGDADHPAQVAEGPAAVPAGDSRWMIALIAG